MINYNPLISIVVPVYNVEEYLDECIESIVNQTYKNLEIILVDDGAKDKSPQICDSWAKQDPRIVVIHKPNGGLSSARNAGLEKVNGEFVGFVDSDDFIDIKMYEVLLDAFTNSSDIGVTSVNVMRSKDGKKEKFFKKCEIYRDRIIEGKDFTISMIKQDSCWTVWNKLYRADLIKNLRFKLGRNNEDTLFMFDLGAKMRELELNLYEVAYPAYFYRIRSESICTSKVSPLAFDIIQNLEDMMCVTTPNERDLLLVLKQTYIITIIRFLDGLIVNINDNDNMNYYTIYRKKLSKTKFTWVLRNSQLKTIIHYLLHVYYPKGRLYMIKVLRCLYTNLR